MNDEVLRALRKTRARLNAAIVAHRAIAWTAPAAIGAGLLVAALRAMGVEAAGLALWAASVAICAAAGASTALASRIGEAEAARWLDERLGDEELLAAALVCLGRGSSGRFDGEIVEKAQALVPRAAAIGIYPRPTAKKAAIAAASCLLGAYLVFLAAPLTASAQAARPREALSGQSGEEPAAEAALSALAAGGSHAAAAFAASLFPEDKRLATLAERALREGRIDDLRDMLRAADLEYESRIARSVTEPERKKLASERERIQDAANAISMGYDPGAEGYGHSPGKSGKGDGSDGDKGSGGSGTDDPDQGDREGKGSGGGTRTAPGARKGGQGEGFGSGVEDEGEGAAGAGQGQAGGLAGRGGDSFGSGSGEAGDWGRIEPVAGPQKAIIEPSKDSSFFELILPGQEASKPIAGLIPDSQRSAESAMAREGLPFEYEEFVRSYFMSLSQGQRP